MKTELRATITQIRKRHSDPALAPWCYEDSEGCKVYPQARQSPCSDCAVTNGLYTEIASSCYQNLPPRQRQTVADGWDCHNGGRCEGAHLVLIDEERR